MMMSMSFMMIAMALLWFPANRIISGQVPRVLIAQAEIFQIGNYSNPEQLHINRQSQTVIADWLIMRWC